MQLETSKGIQAVASQQATEAGSWKQEVGSRKQGAALFGASINTEESVFTLTKQKP